VGHVDDELAELRAELERPDPDPDRVGAELGDVLFAVAALGRMLGIEPESALRGSVDTFTRRFSAMERIATQAGRELESLSDHEWTEYWERAKEANESPA
jgi:nucleoside triphosphate diphosphatase